MEWVKSITEVINALSHYAWPVLVGLTIWWFRKRIPELLQAIATRIARFEGFGFKIEAEKQEVKLERSPSFLAPLPHPRRDQKRADPSFASLLGSTTSPQPSGPYYLPPSSSAPGPTLPKLIKSRLIATPLVALYSLTVVASDKYKTLPKTAIPSGS
jgi:hypothetical protein